MGVYLKLCMFLLGAIVLVFSSNMCPTWTLWIILGDGFNDDCYLVAGIGTGVIIAILVFARFVTCLLARILYLLVAVWWGLLVYNIICSIIYLIIHAIVPVPQVVGLMLIVGLPCAIAVYGMVHSLSLQVEYENVKIPTLEGTLRIAHICDLHLGPIYRSAHVARIVAAIKPLQADCVVITGDLFDGSTTLTPDLVEPFNQLAIKVYFVLGNHDAMVSGIDEVQAALANSNIILLRNELVQFQHVNLLGLDYSPKKSDIIARLKAESYPRTKPLVLLYHVPILAANDLEKYNVSLHLAGHTHGGQMAPLHLQAWVLFKYVSGMHRSSQGHHYVYVSPGTATAGPPLRLLSTGTITLLTLHP